MWGQEPILECSPWKLLYSGRLPPYLQTFFFVTNTRGLVSRNGCPWLSLTFSGKWLAHSSVRCFPLVWAFGLTHIFMPRPEVIWYSGEDKNFNDMVSTRCHEKHKNLRNLFSPFSKFKMFLNRKKVWRVKSIFAPVVVNENLYHQPCLAGRRKKKTIFVWIILWCDLHHLKIMFLMCVWLEE